MSNRKKYTKEFKREAIRLVEQRGNRTIQQVAEELGVEAKKLYSWRSKLKEQGQMPERRVQ